MLTKSTIDVDEKFSVAIAAYMKGVTRATRANDQTHPRPCVVSDSSQTHSKHLPTKTILISTYVQQHRTKYLF